MLSRSYQDCLSFAEAESGDEFYLVDISSFSGPVSVTFCKVDRAGKRDVVFTAVGGGPERRVTRSTTLPNAYLTREETAWAEDIIRLNSKRALAWKAIQAHRKAITEDLADQIIAWEQALEANEPDE